MRFYSLVISAAAFGLLMACEEALLEPETACDPGELYDCDCDDGGTGVAECSDDGESLGTCGECEGEAPETYCDPGELYECDCDDGSTGVAECSNDGESLGTCEGCEGGVTESYCDPGEPYECDCDDGSTGVAECSADGESLGTCEECGGAETVRIEIREAVVLPIPSETEAWDGFDTPPPELWTAIISIAAKAPVPGSGEIVNGVLELGISAVDAPDPEGTARLVQPDGDQTLSLEENTNEVHPIWTGKVFRGVVLSADTSVSVTLHDVDLSDNDEIGSLDITIEDLLDAWSDGGGWWVESTNITYDRVVGVKIAVISE